MKVEGAEGVGGSGGEGVDLKGMEVGLPEAL